MSHLFDCHFWVYVVIGEKRSVSFIKYLSGTGRMILGWYTRITPVLFYKLLRTVCAFEITRNMLYLQCCPTDTRQREEVSLYGNHHFFYCLLHGKHSRLLCLQMVRGRQVGQHQPSGYLSAINKQEEAPSIRTTEGFILFVYMDSSFLFAYWHYSICKMKVQYAKKVTDSQNGNVL